MALGSVETVTSESTSPCASLNSALEGCENGFKQDVQCARAVHTLHAAQLKLVFDFAFICREDMGVAWLKCPCHLRGYEMVMKTCGRCGGPHRAAEVRSVRVGTHCDVVSSFEWAQRSSEGAQCTAHEPRCHPALSAP